MDGDFCDCGDCIRDEERHLRGHEGEETPELSCVLCREEIRMKEEEPE